MDNFTFDDLYVRRLKEHDRETVEHFVRHFSKRIEIKARTWRLPPGQQVEDVRQEVFLRTLASLDKLRDSSKLPSFVLGICNNVLLEGSRVPRPEPLDDWILVILDNWDTEVELLRKEDAEAVRQTLSDMGDSRDTDILRAIFLQDLDRDEVCQRSGIKPENLAVILHRAKEKFRAAFRKIQRKKDFLKGPKPLDH